MKKGQRMTAVTNIKGVGEALGKALVANGFKTAEAIAKANPADLVKVPRIGAARAPLLIAAAKEAVSSKPATKPTAKPAVRRTAVRKPATRKPAARKTVAAAAAEKRAQDAARKATEEKAAEAAEAKAKKKAKQCHTCKIRKPKNASQIQFV